MGEFGLTILLATFWLDQIWGFTHTTHEENRTQASGVMSEHVHLGATTPSPTLGIESIKFNSVPYTRESFHISALKHTYECLFVCLFVSE